MSTPSIELSPAAAEELRAAGAGGPEGDIHLEIGPEGQHDLYLAPAEAGEIKVESQGLAIWIKEELAERAHGIKIDFVQADGGAGFKIDDPAAPPRVQNIAPAELKSMLDAKQPLELLDVRTFAEIELAKIEGSRQLLPEVLDELEERGFDTPIVLYCHMGPRSRAAAERLVQMGFKKVYNLTGGIDAWSLTVDPSVRRY